MHNHLATRREFLGAFAAATLGIRGKEDSWGAGAPLASSAIPSMTTAPVFDVGSYWIATALASGALQWLGSAAMESAFGGSSTRIDISRIIEETVRQVAGVVQREFRVDAVRRATAALEATESSLRDYQLAPDPLRLEAATAGVTSVVAELRSLELAGHEGYMAATSLGMVIRQERARRSARFRRGELGRLVEEADKAIRHHEAMTSAWRDWNAGLYRLTVECNETLCGFWVMKRDVVLLKTGKYNAHTRLEFVKKHAAETFSNEVHPVRVAPGDKIVENWAAIRDGAIWCLANEVHDLDKIAAVTKQFADGVHMQDIDLRR